VVGQSLGDLKSEAKPGFSVSVDLSSCRPSVYRANIFYASEVRRQLTPQKGYKLLDDFGSGQS
jgi:hypothetical protein